MDRPDQSLSVFISVKPQEQVKSDTDKVINIVQLVTTSLKEETGKH